MTSNYFYDLPIELQNYIYDIVKKTEEIERHQAEVSKRYDWFMSLWYYPNTPQYHNNRKSPQSTR